MKASIVGYGVTMAATMALLGGCGALRQAQGGTLAQGDAGPPGAMPASRAHRALSYNVLYRFDRYPNGETPKAGLINIGSTLYGTASEGGVKGCHQGGGCGTVFSVSTKGVEHLIYSFSTRTGVYPMSRLADVKGTLYGTTFQGGPYAKGVVYSVTASGVEALVHGFLGRLDGGLPTAPLTNVKGTLYGTTDWGGKKRNEPMAEPVCCGTVYGINESGAHTVLHRFKGGKDGRFPNSGLINVKGTLYGTTGAGGGTGCSYGIGCGTFYSITRDGVLSVLYSFAGGSDGDSPAGDLINVNGTLYGVTTQGGGTGCGGSGCGTVYSITTSGQETVLYRFAGGYDGATPRAGLVSFNGTLYGTTANGGSNPCGGFGCGTIYSISTTGAETVLYTFAGGSDGNAPEAPLLTVKGTLYGTTVAGGGGAKGAGCCGTVFSLQP